MLVAVGLISAQRLGFFGEDTTTDLISRLKPGDRRADLLNGLFALTSLKYAIALL